MTAGSARGGTGQSDLKKLRKLSGTEANGGETKPSWNIVPGSGLLALSLPHSPCPPPSAPNPSHGLPPPALLAEGSPSWSSILSGATRRVSSSPRLHYLSHSLDSFTSCLDSGLRCCEKSGFPATSLPLIILSVPSTCYGPFYHVLFEAGLVLPSAVPGLEQDILRH